MTEVISITPQPPVVINITPEAPTGNVVPNPIIIGPGQGGAVGPKGEDGADGATGPQGPQGPPGPTLAYVHTQNTSSNSWVITHNLGIYPQVSVVEFGGSNVEGDVSYQNTNQLTVSFSVSVSGYAYLS